MNKMPASEWRQALELLHFCIVIAFQFLSNGVLGECAAGLTQ